MRSTRHRPTPLSRAPFSICGLAERSIHNAIQAFSSGDTEQARRVMAHDEIIDRDDAVDTMRSDHRTHARALERIADLATDICRQLIYLRTGCITRHKPD